MGTRNKSPKLQDHTAEIQNRRARAKLGPDGAIRDSKKSSEGRDNQQANVQESPDEEQCLWNTWFCAAELARVRTATDATGNIEAGYKLCS